MTDETDTERAAREARELLESGMPGSECHPLTPERISHLDAAIRADHEAKLARRQARSEFLVVDIDGAVARGVMQRGHEDDFGWVLIKKTGDAYELIGSDGGEPEDQLLVRNWGWVAPALQAEHDATRAALTASQDQLAARDEVIAELRAAHTVWRLTDECRASAERELFAERAAHEQTKRELGEAETRVALLTDASYAHRTRDFDRLATERDTLRAERDEARDLAVRRGQIQTDQAARIAALCTVLASARWALADDRGDAVLQAILDMNGMESGVAEAMRSDLEARIATLTAERDAALKVPGEIVAWLRKFANKHCGHSDAMLLHARCDVIETHWCAAKAETKEG